MCGKRYRVRNALPGARTECSECGSLVEVTAADLVTGYTADGLITLHDDQIEAKDAIPVGDNTVRLADKGSRPGVTEKSILVHEEAAIAAAMAGRAIDGLGGLSHGTVGSDVYDESEPGARRRGFVNAMLASFWFAGRRKNAMNLVLTAMPLALTQMLWAVLPFPFSLLALFFLFIMIMAIVQFYWSVLIHTTRGEDEIPWFDTDWNMWDDIVRPLWWIIWISVLCSVPSMVVARMMPPGPSAELAGWIALAGGWFFWPVAVMSYALGRSFAFLRPDWLVRCIIGIGPAYLIAWGLVMLTLIGWWGYYHAESWLAGQFVAAGLPVVFEWLMIPVMACVSSFMTVYFGYVLFRMIGLQFRHYRDRFPWKF
jgi:hypothetical protein